MSIKRFVQRGGAVVAITGTIGLLSMNLASAHVTANIYGTAATKGGYAAIFLRVPNEKADAGTTKIEVTVNPDYGISSLRTKPVPGWTAEVSKTKLATPVKNGAGQEVAEAVTKVSWTAQPGTKIAAGSTEFQEFEISAGPLPTSTESIMLPTAQTYDNGVVVQWDQAPSANGGEPEHPAPVVQLAAASAGGHGHQGTAEPQKGTEDANHDDQAVAAGTDETARWLGGAGLIVGALGLGFGAGAVLRTRKNRAPVTPEAAGASE